MEKITTVEQLKTICVAQQEAEKQERVSILVCGGTGCQSSDSQKIVENLRAELAAQGLEDMVEVVRTGCFGFCEKGPIVKILPDNTFYTQVKPEDAKEIVESHIMNNEKVQRLLYLDPKTNEHISDSKHMDFYKKQQRVALRNCGYIDPENIKDYIRQEGYQGACQVYHADEAGRGHRGSQKIRPSWTRRRGFPDRAEMGSLPEGIRQSRNTWSATRMKEIRALSWIVRF